MAGTDVKLEWNGDEVYDGLLTAAWHAVDDLTAEAARAAQADAPEDTGRLKAGIMKGETVYAKGGGVHGAFGVDKSVTNDGVYYPVIVEITHPTKAGFLRRAADSTFKKLEGEIARRVPKGR